MQSRAVPFSIVHFASIESTHVWAANNLPLLVSEHGLGLGRPVRISTDVQTKGIGQKVTLPDGHRIEKKWVGSQGNIAATFVFPWPQEKIATVINLPQVAASAVVTLLQDFGLQPSVKWINDVLVGNKKIAGVLCSATGHNLHADGIPEQFTAILVSVGLNVLSVPCLDHLDKNERQSVTCIATEIQQCGAAPTAPQTPDTILDVASRTASPSDSPVSSKQPSLSVASVLDDLSIALYKRMSEFELRGFAPVHSFISPLLIGKGCIVTIKNPSICPPENAKPLKTPKSYHIDDTEKEKVEDIEHLQGEYLGLSPTSGCLLLKLGNGDVKEIFSGQLILS